MHKLPHFPRVPRSFLPTLFALVIVALSSGTSKAQQATLTDDSTYPQDIGSSQSLVVQGPSAVRNQPASSAYIKFKLTGSASTQMGDIPSGTPGSDVKKATLRLFVSGVTAAGSFNVYRVIGPWGENGANPPPYDTASPIATNVQVPSANSFLALDITPLAKQWLNCESQSETSGCGNYGLAFVPDASTPTMSFSFDSKEAKSTSHQAQLSVLLDHVAVADSFTGNLSGDVTGTQSATVVAAVGGKTAADVAAAAAAVNSATENVIGGTLVRRDVNGNFSAGAITANLNGNVTGNAGTVTNGVYTIGDQTISGTKTFANPITGSVTGTASAITGTLDGTKVTGAVALADIAKSVRQYANDPAADSNAGLIILNTTSNTFKISDGTAWRVIGANVAHADNATTADTANALAGSATVQATQINGKVATAGSADIANALSSTATINAGQVNGKVAGAVQADTATVANTVTVPLSLNGVQDGTGQGVVNVFNNSNSGSAVVGWNNGANGGAGVYGKGRSYGVFGDGVYGVYGSSDRNPGFNGSGVFGSGSTGVTGSGSVRGMFGDGAEYGMFGQSAKTGVFGDGQMKGVHGRSASAAGVGLYGEGLNGATAGLFKGDVKIEGNLNVTGATTATVAHATTADSANALSSTATISATQVSGKVASAANADNATTAGSAAVLTGTVNASQISGKVASAITADTADVANTANTVSVPLNLSGTGNVLSVSTTPGGIGVFGGGGTIGVQGQSTVGVGGTGVLGTAAPGGIGVTGRGGTIGVQGEYSGDQGGAGVQGISGTSASSAGVYGLASHNGTAVRGNSSNGLGVEGNSAGNHGVAGASASATAAGIYGRNVSTGPAGLFDGNVTINGNFSVSGTNNLTVAKATTADTANALAATATVAASQVTGKVASAASADNASTAGTVNVPLNLTGTVDGNSIISATNNSGSGFGLQGSSVGIGVLGYSANYRGVQGSSVQGYGVVGYSDSRIGVQGNGPVGVEGNGNTGVFGNSINNGFGVYGTSKAGVGVLGTVTDAGSVAGVQGTTNQANAVGIIGANTGGGLAGRFDGNVTVNGNLTVTGTSNANSGGVPVGTVVSFAGLTSKIPQGWKICDGTLLNRVDYSALFDAIGTSWGSPDANTFHLPDLRGKFLRGVDGGSGNDPDASSREAAKSGGNAGDNVGSIQNDGFASHTHDISPQLNVGHSINGDGNAARRIDSDDGPSFQNINEDQFAMATGGRETRPENAGVYWIIKVQ